VRDVEERDADLALDRLELDLYCCPLVRSSTVTLIDGSSLTRAANVSSGPLYGIG
jgi:hypothetical protein